MATAARLRSTSSSSDSSVSEIPIGLQRKASSSASSSSNSDEEAAGKPSPPSLSTREPAALPEMASKTVSLEFSYLELDLETIDISLRNQAMRAELITTLNLRGNDMSMLPSSIANLVNMRSLDISENNLKSLPDSLSAMKELTVLHASSNHLTCTSFPKDFGSSLAACLKVLNLGGNQLTGIPCQLLQLRLLQKLYLGSNQISDITLEICKLENLRVLYMGGNKLTHVPAELGRLQHLNALSLCENKLTVLPPSIALLRNLKSLALHNNQLTALPPEIVKLRGLHELSLRNNPLVCRFVKDFTFDCPSLLELAGRCVKSNRIPFNESALPAHLVRYLATARRCVNAKCKGVYFDSRVEHIKFVDFCGVYRLPLLQYLCSPSCTLPSGNRPSSSSDSSDDMEDVPLNKLKRVLLG